METKRVYSILQIFLASAFSGPLPAFYMLSKNYAQFEKETESKRTMKIGIFIFLIVIGVAFFLPVSNGFGILYSILISIYARKIQEVDIKKALSEGAITRSGMEVVKPILLGLILLIIVFFVIAFIQSIEVVPV